jgi:hypothetical protein
MYFKGSAYEDGKKGKFLWVFQTSKLTKTSEISKFVKLEDNHYMNALIWLFKKGLKTQCYTELHCVFSLVGMRSSSTWVGRLHELQHNNKLYLSGTTIKTIIS